MIVNLEEVGQMVAIAGTVGIGIKFVIIRPLQNTIVELNKTIAGLGVIIDRLREDQHDIDKRVVAVENRAKSAHHRIDRLEEVINK